MHTNVIPFPAARRNDLKRRFEKTRNNVIQLAEWRDRVKLRRTTNGVYFVSNVLAFSGDAA